MADHEEEELTIAQPSVVTKYKTAADVTNAILLEVVEACKDGAEVVDICEMGDRRIVEETGKIFKKDKEMKKGIAFPTCISVNNCICHYSPLRSESSIKLADGDLVKIDLGVHFDGFPAVVAHTMVVGASLSNKVTGRKADVVLAAHNAAEAALRLVKPGNENTLVTDKIQKVCEEFDCKPVEGMQSHQLLQHRIDGEKVIILNPNENQRKEYEKAEFSVHEVYGVDVLVSSGDGKGRESECRTTVYKKRPDLVYQLKMKTSRQFFSEVQNKYSDMPFTLRSFTDEKKAKLGVTECVNHNIVDPFPVLNVKEGDLVAQFKFTALLMPNNTMRITQGPFDPSLYVSDHHVKDLELKTLLQSSTNPKSAKKKKKRAEKAAAAAAVDAMEGIQSGDQATA